MKIIYFAGFGGKINSFTLSNLSEKYPSAKFVVYDNENPKIAYEQIQKQLKNIISEQSLIIGQSLGGFWAEIFGIKYGVKTILINPSIEPNISLKKYDLSSENLENYLKFKENKSLSEKFSIILSSRDEVVDKKPVLEKYNGKTKFIYIDENHQIENLEPIFEEIKKIMN